MNGTTGHTQEQLDDLIAAQRYDEAAVGLRAMLAGRPDDVDLLCTTGMVAEKQADFTSAARCFFHVLEIDPGEAAAYFHLGILYAKGGRHIKAISAFREALRLRPRFAEVHVSLAKELFRQRRAMEAEIHYRAAIDLMPDLDNRRYHLAPSRGGDTDREPLLRRYRTAAYRGLAAIDTRCGRFDDALCCHRHIVALGANSPRDYSNLLFRLAYDVLCSPQVLLEEHREYARRFAGKVPARVFTYSRKVSPEKRLKVGYVSPDFTRHPVSYFFEPVLQGHDRTKVEVFCYGEVAHPDSVTARLQGEADHWLSTVGLDNEVLARRIHDDGIDILVDLAGHTANNRLPVFAHKPAPVQATYLGYCTTTGLDAMDYWITDNVVTPVDTVERTVEEIVRLPRCWLCYRPDAEAPAVVDRAHGATLTFGSFNNISKLTDTVIAVWSEILNAVPGARLLIKTHVFNDEGVCRVTRERFSAAGVDADRLELREDTVAYLGEYADVDIALDPFPRTGGATTADALWMAVPVVTLAGERMIERQGASLLSAVGLEELIAKNSAEYVGKAVALARDPERRQALRARLRDRMAASELCDGRGLAAALEDAYREMWIRYVKREA